MWRALLGRAFRVLASRLPLLSLAASTIVVAASGCGWPSSKPKAALSLGCSEDQLTIQRNTTYSEVVSGCGKSDVMTFDGGSWASLRERAAFELSCPASEIDVRIISSSLYGVMGCNKKVVYKYVPNAGIVIQSAQETGDALPADPAAMTK
ncbi:hypothetical protein [Sorangium sp. So ce1078]|uniref:hypothetical protein n=1 Tax=Sorangium sp. So ce1078 TaxID=3133329 RepID=UPI003F606A46